MKADGEALVRLLSNRLRLDSPCLKPLAVECAWPVFRVTSAGREAFFLKVTTREAAERSLSFLKAVREVPFFPRPLVPEPLEFGPHAVLCLEWKESVRVNAEEMTAIQLKSFAQTCRTMAEVLANYCGSVTPLSSADSPDCQYASLAEYARRHWLSRHLLRPLLSLPECERTYGARQLTVIHGDLQPKNYGFDGDRLVAVFDTDDLTRGLACEDAAYAFTERARRSELTATERRRLGESFRSLIRLLPWSRQDWQIAVNHARLRIAARRLEKHPNSPFIAFDIARRDRPLRDLARLLEGGDLA